jgi:hypothetical protein
MPTPAEKKALVFLASVAIAGSAVRATGAATRAQTADAASREALRRQIVAVESAGAADRRGRGKGRAPFDAGSAPGGRQRRKSAGATDASSGRGREPARGRDAGVETDPRSIFAPPSPQRPARGLFMPQRVADRERSAPNSTTAPIDVDRATAQELERLPRIGPALAVRIVTDRDQYGPYGSLDALQRVRGIGPAMVRELTPYVTFSGTPRPSIAGEAGASAASAGTHTRVRAGSAPDRRSRRPAPP